MDEDARAYYARGDEQERLGADDPEYVRTLELVRRGYAQARALAEAARVTRGVVLAAAVSRYASLAGGIVLDWLGDPAFRSIVEQDVRDGARGSRRRSSTIPTSCVRRSPTRDWSSRRWSRSKASRRFARACPPARRSASGCSNGTRARVGGDAARVSSHLLAVGRVR